MMDVTLRVLSAEDKETTHYNIGNFKRWLFALGYESVGRRRRPIKLSIEGVVLEL